ncbi:hypothetical protein CLOP_g14337, partial [Closterium sp. NIES-67]
LVSAPQGVQQGAVQQQVARHGGVVSANLSRAVTHAVAHSAESGRRFKAAVGAGDVLSYNWLQECLQASKLIPPKSKHYLHLSPGTAQRQQQQMDEFGDSYTDDIADTQELKQLFARMPKPVAEAVDSRDLARYRQQMCVESGAVNTCIFQGVSLFALPCLPALHQQHSWGEWQCVSDSMAGRRAVLEVEMGGGTVAPKLSTHVTHLLLPPCLAVPRQDDVAATVEMYEERLTASELALLSRALSVHAPSPPAAATTEEEEAAAAQPQPRTSTRQLPPHVPRVITVACVESRLKGQGEEGPWEGVGGPSCPAYPESSDDGGGEGGQDEEWGSSTDSGGATAAPGDGDHGDGSDGDGSGKEEEEDEETTDDEGGGSEAGEGQATRSEGVGEAMRQQVEEERVPGKIAGSTKDGDCGLSGLRPHSLPRSQSGTADPGACGAGGSGAGGSDASGACVSEWKEQEQHESKRLRREERQGNEELVTVAGVMSEGSGEANDGFREEMDEMAREGSPDEREIRNGSGESEEAGSRFGTGNGAGKVERRGNDGGETGTGGGNDKVKGMLDFFFS